MSPAEVKLDIDSIANYLHELGIRVFVVGIPKRRNVSFNSICRFNDLLSNESYQYVYVGVSYNMSCENVLQSDDVHLNRYGLTQLKTVINKKVLQFLRNE